MLANTKIDPSGNLRGGETGDKREARTAAATRGTVGSAESRTRTRRSRQGMLVFDGAWRFDSPGEIASGVVGGFFDLVGQIAAQSPSR